ncbi:DoxX family membrane protein (plasmid) [Priestia megaterium]|uniref:DoxX family membrane protein n=1 Tax=Priestia megaterium TaxID=1404 RepID=UPI003CFCA323
MNKIKSYNILRMVFGLIIIGSGIAMLFGLTGNIKYPSAGANEFMRALENTGYFMPFLAIVKIVCGIALITNRFTKLALVIFMPVSINMTMFHLFLGFSSGIPAYIILVLNTYLLFMNIEYYRLMLKVK